MSLTVITPAASRRLVDLAAARLLLGWSADDVSDDLLGAWLDQISAAVETVCGRAFPLERVREQVCPSRGLVLSRFPLAAVHSVTDQDGTALAAKAWQIVDGAAGVLCVSCGGLVSVEYSAGFAVVPADLQALAIEALRQQRASQERPVGLREEQLGDYRWQASSESMNAVGGLTPALRAALDAWRDGRLF